MTDENVVIVGSGPAAAGVALALLASPRPPRITVLDVGQRLESSRQHVVDRLATSRPSQWQPADVETISAQPVKSSRASLPQKRAYGSDFPFRDAGQLHDMQFFAGSNSSPVSAAFGGFSNVWGAQTMPFSAATFTSWPIDFDDLAPHYTAVLDEVPLAAEVDDLAETFPLLTDRARPLPQLAPRTDDVLRRYAAHRDEIRSAGVTVGRARLALRSDDCVRCGLCMTGCPYGLIYSASQTFDRLIRDGLVDYRPGSLVVRVREEAERCVLSVRDTSSGRLTAVEADRVFLGAGGIGTTRLVLGSLAHAPRHVTLGESVQFALPFLSRRSTGDPRQHDDFTLNQFNMLVSFDDDDLHTSQVHCYPYNPAVLGALPGLAAHPALTSPTGRLLGRLTVGLGYLPSWASPRVRVDVGDPALDDRLPSLTIGAGAPERTSLMLGEVMTKLKRAGKYLDFRPVPAALQLAAEAKSYHFGGSLAHRANSDFARPDELSTDRLGRPGPWRRIHAVDGSVFPSVPSTTFTLTVMANAHRIASEVLGQHADTASAGSGRAGHA